MYNDEKTIMRDLFNSVSTTYNAIFGFIGGLNFNKVIALLSFLVMLIINSRQIAINLTFWYNKIFNQKKGK